MGIHNNLYILNLFYNLKPRRKRAANLNSFLNNILRLAIVIILARYYGPERFGIFIFFMTFFYFFIVMDNFWIGQILRRAIKKNKGDDGFSSYDRIVIGNGMIIRILLSLMAIVLLWFNALAINRPIVTEVSVYVSIGLILAAIYLSCRMISGFGSESDYLTSHFTLKKISILFVIFLVIYLTGDILRLYKSVLAIWFLIVLLTAYSSLKRARPIFKINFGLWRRIVRRFPILGIEAICTYVYFFAGYFMLLYMKGFGALGLYSSAANLTEGFIILLIFYVVHKSQLVARRHLVFGRAYNKNLHCILIIFIAFILTIFSRPALAAVYGGRFSEAAPALSILIWAEALAFFGLVGGFNAYRRAKLIFMFLAISINLFLNFILIPKYGLTGSAIAALISGCAWPNRSLFLRNYAFSSLRARKRLV